MSLQVKVRSGSYFFVFWNVAEPGVNSLTDVALATSKHTQNYKALERSSEILEGDPGALVRVEHRYVADVKQTDVIADPQQPPPADPPPPSVPVEPPVPLGELPPEGVDLIEWLALMRPDPEFAKMVRTNDFNVAMDVWAQASHGTWLFTTNYISTENEDGTFSSHAIGFGWRGFLGFWSRRNVDIRIFNRG